MNRLLMNIEKISVARLKVEVELGGYLKPSLINSYRHRR